MPFWESGEARATRENLEYLASVTLQFLTQAYAAIEPGADPRDRKNLVHLEVLKRDCFQKIRQVRARLARGLGFTLRRALRRVGLYERELHSKLQLLWDCIRDKSLKPALEFLDIVLESLAMVLPLFHCIVEFKQIVEFVIDRMGQSGDLVTLDISLPELR